jgi:hypothetical protein
MSQKKNAKKSRGENTITGEFQVLLTWTALYGFVG